MKRFHVHLHVSDLGQSIAFYSSLFAARPTRIEKDYAKWMLEDPRVNFAISTRGNRPGLDHLGFQVDGADELGELKGRAEAAGMALRDEGATTCCYARSAKHWVTDPQGVAWEHFHTLGNIPVFNDAQALPAAAAAACCPTGAPSVPVPASGAAACCGPMAQNPSNAADKEPSMTSARSPLNVLFLCTHNSARSILAEALLNHMGQGRFKAHSAGSSPRDSQQPHSLGLQVLRNAGIATDGLRSKSWSEFAALDAPQMDLIITVCDNAAGEVCPIWPGHPATAHWGYADPSEGDGTEAQKLEAFRHTLHAIKHRLELLVALPEEKLLGQTVLQSAARQLAAG